MIYLGVQWVHAGWPCETSEEHWFKRWKFSGQGKGHENKYEQSADKPARRDICRTFYLSY
jgi:hypothetical protein